MAMLMPSGQMEVALAEYKDRRTTFRRWLLEQLKQGVHYGYPPGCEPRGNVNPEQWTNKPSLYKAGADFMCDLMGVRDEYEADNAAWEQLGRREGTFVFCCRLFSRSGTLVGEGRGAFADGQKKMGVNAALKMAKKCLAGRTPIVVRSQRGILRTDIHRAYLHDGPLEIAAPNGTWRQIVSITKMRPEPLVKVRFRNGSDIVCTAWHPWPAVVPDGPDEIVAAADLSGREVRVSRIPCGDGIAGDWLGWLVGIYLAEGSISDDAVRFHLNEDESWIAETITKYCAKLGVSTKIRRQKGKAALVVSANGKAIVGLMRHFINGSFSRNKRLSVHAWRQGQPFLNALLDGYLDGDGCRVNRHGRTSHWIIGFTGKNRELRNDLMALSSMLGLRCSIRPSTATAAGKTHRTFKGWIKDSEPKYNGKALGEVLSVTPAPESVTYNIEVDGDHLFCLADGLVTHNCAKVDAVINSWGLSDLFTQDIEDDDKPHQTRRGSSRPSAPASKTHVEEIIAGWKQHRGGDARAFGAWAQSVCGVASAQALNSDAWTEDAIEAGWRDLNGGGEDAFSV